MPIPDITIDLSGNKGMIEAVDILQLKMVVLRAIMEAQVKQIKMKPI